MFNLHYFTWIKLFNSVWAGINFYLTLFLFHVSRAAVQCLVLSITTCHQDLDKTWYKNWHCSTDLEQLHGNTHKLFTINHEIHTWAGLDNSDKNRVLLSRRENNNGDFSGFLQWTDFSLHLFLPLFKFLLGRDD